LAAYGPAWSPDREHHRERLPSIHDLPRAHALETTAGKQQGPHALLGAVMAEIETYPGHLMLFHSVRANVSAIYRLSFACTQGRIEME
jgi:predicted GH43/DUF377 family glycosyl hydrolase